MNGVCKRSNGCSKRDSTLADQPKATPFLPEIASKLIALPVPPSTVSYWRRSATSGSRSFISMRGLLPPYLTENLGAPPELSLPLVPWREVPSDHNHGFDRQTKATTLAENDGAETERSTTYARLFEPEHPHDAPATWNRGHESSVSSCGQRRISSVYSVTPWCINFVIFVTLSRVAQTRVSRLQQPTTDPGHFANASLLTT